MNFQIKKNGSDFVLIAGVSRAQLKERFPSEFNYLTSYELLGEDYVIPRAKLCRLLDECIDHFSEESLIQITKLLDKKSEVDLREQVKERSISKRRMTKKPSHEEDREREYRVRLERQEKERKEIENQEKLVREFHEKQEREFREQQEREHPEKLEREFREQKEREREHLARVDQERVQQEREYRDLRERQERVKKEVHDPSERKTRESHSKQEVEPQRTNPRHREEREQAEKERARDIKRDIYSSTRKTPPEQNLDLNYEEPVQKVELLKWVSQMKQQLDFLEQYVQKM